LIDGDEIDIELVESDPGSSDLLPADQEMLTRLGEQFVQRGDLSLEIEGRFDPKVDPPALRRARLEQLIESRRPAATAAAPAGSSALETILEGLFTEQFSAEALAGERQKFTTSPAGGPTPDAGATAGAAAPPMPAAPALAPQTVAGATSGFDASGFYESLRQKLLDAQVVTSADLSKLGAARAETILAVLTKAGAVDASRIKSGEPAAVKRSKKGSSRIASEMKMSGGDQHASHAHGATQALSHQMPGMLTPKQMEELKAAKGVDFDLLFLNGMIQHHEGALVMVKDLHDSPGTAQDAELFNFASDVDSGQRAEIKIMESMLGERP
jgi:predicted outer membrane protein